MLARFDAIFVGIIESPFVEAQRCVNSRAQASGLMVSTCDTRCYSLPPNHALISFVKRVYQFALSSLVSNHGCLFLPILSWNVSREPQLAVSRPKGTIHPWHSSLHLYHV